MSVNDCDRHAMQNHIRDSIKIWQKRSKKKWDFNASGFPRINEMIRTAQKQRQKIRKISEREDV